MSYSLSKCVKGMNFHQWDLWHVVHKPDDGLMPANGLLYMRECQVLGCNVVQRCGDLVPDPDGKVEFSVLPFSDGFERG